VDVVVPGSESARPSTSKKSIRDLVQNYEAKNANSELSEGAAFYFATGTLTAGVLTAEKVHDLSGRLGRAMRAAGSNIYVGAIQDLRQKLYAVQENRNALAKALSQFKDGLSSGAKRELGELTREVQAAQAAYDHSKSVMASRGALVVSSDFKIRGLEEESERLAKARSALEAFWNPENLGKRLGNNSQAASRVLSAKEAIQKLTPMGEKLSQELAQATKSTAAELGRTVRRFVGSRISGAGHMLEKNRGAIRWIGVGAAGLQLVYAGGLILQMTATEDQALIQVKEEINGTTRDLGSTSLPVPVSHPDDMGADIIRQTGKTNYGGDMMRAGSVDFPTP